MHEAINYDALAWVRQELDETLKQARLQLEAYAADIENTTLLSNCAANLHQALGPLQMVEVKGAVLLVTEMEELIADLFQEAVGQPETAFELLMQAFLQIPDYLSSLRSGRSDQPELLLPLVNEMRTARGAEILQETAVFSPDLSGHVPVSVFDVRAEPVKQDIPVMARAARVRFQSGQLVWYRSGESSGLQDMIDVLQELQQNAASEPVVRVWWVAIGVVEALRDNFLESSVVAKKLLGQVDQQIKRLMDSGESIFSDVFTDDLMRDLLFQVARVDSQSERIALIKSTYSLQKTPTNNNSGTLLSDSPLACNDEMLRAVAGTIRSEIGNIKDQLDNYDHSSADGTQGLLPVAEGLHVLGNTLAMIGMDSLGSIATGQEQFVRSLVEGTCKEDDSGLDDIANTLVAIEDALGECVSNDTEGLVFRQGIEAVTKELMANMSRAKEAISTFIKTPGEFESLAAVPDLLNQVDGGLQLSDQGRAAIAIRQVSKFITSELIEQNKTLSEEQLETLADAICSVEIHIEEYSVRGNGTGTALDIAEDSLAALDYPCPEAGEQSCAADEITEPEDVSCEDFDSITQEEYSDAVADTAVPQDAQDIEISEHESVANSSSDIAVPPITDMQIIAADVDEEILPIFIEEADEELEKLSKLIPLWTSSPENLDLLADMRRSFHTLKGSGRMVGALAVGEFSWSFENMLNKLLDGVVSQHDEMRVLLGQSLDALSQLMAQVKDSSVVPETDVNYLAHQACIFSEPGGIVTVSATESVDLVDSRNEPLDVEAVESSQGGTDDFPVLSVDADPEIVEIFLEEADEISSTIAESIPEWLNQPENEEALATSRRCMHTLKGSGRMAGALFMGEFCGSIESLLNRIVEGSITVGEPVFTLLGKVPEALVQLIEQVQGNSEPTLDINGLKQVVDALQCGEVVASIEVVQEASVEDGSSPELTCAEEVACEDEEPSIIDIYSSECVHLLQAITEFLETENEPRVVTDDLFRALHTLSGISESAEIHSIRGLASDLNEHFEWLYQSQQVLCQDAVAVLLDSSLEISRLLQQLPEQEFDEESQAALRQRIKDLPQINEQPEQADDPVSTVVEDAGEEGISGATDPYADLDQELYEIFVEEASEVIENSDSALRTWSDEPDNQDVMAEFSRHLHTLKGGARMVDMPAIGDLSHAVESLMTHITDGHVATSDEVFSLLRDSHDQLSDMLEQVKMREVPLAATVLEVELNSLVTGNVATPASAQAVTELEVVEDNAGQKDDPVPEAADADEEPAVVENSEDEKSGVFAHQDAAPDIRQDEQTATVSPVAGTMTSLPEVDRRNQNRVRSEQIRVQADLLDDMVNHAGEISIYRSRLEQQASDYRFNLAELDQTITRLRDQLRQLEMETEAQILFRYEQETEASNDDFDPLEMDRYSNLQQTSRSLIESISDLRSIQELMEAGTRESETLLLQQSRVSTDLQEGLMRTRMIPFSSLASRLRRIVRQSARELGKEVELQLVGADGEIDRTLIERIIAPVEHMLRNAIAHGIEAPSQRKKSGKPAEGVITVSFEREGSEIVLRIADNGAGMDIDAIRSRALERGLMTADAELPDVDVMQFVLQTGFSTATEVTQISGRGVGMDVVNSEVKQLGGTLHIESTAGQGALFTVRLPYSLAINQALLVTAGDVTFCVPLDSVEGVVRANTEELTYCYSTKECIYRYAGNDYQLKHLGTLLGTGSLNIDNEQGRLPVLLARIGEQRIALQVESLIGSREVVVKPVGAQLSTVHCISGATILGDGKVVVILDVAAVSRISVNAQMVDTPAQAESESRLVVMVVDDSITVRKVTTRLLERNGFKVLTAKDGVDAMGQLQEQVPDMMLLDIEMPRMDGFELATHMRNDDQLKHVPIIMITSRTGDKHRERARQIGVNNYLGKPYQEHDLLECIQEIIGVSTADEVA